MKPRIILAALAATFACAPSAEGAQKPGKDYSALREKKLAKPVFHGAAKWSLDYDAARKRAAEENKLLLVYFTRSYAP